MKPLGSIDRLRELWSGHTDGASRRMCWAAAFSGIFAATLIGRIGTDWSRAAAAAAVVVGVVPAIVRRALLARRAQDPRAVMHATIMRTEPELARAALRALALTTQTKADASRGSTTLADLHFGRLLGRVDLVSLDARANRFAWAATGVGLAVATIAFGVIIIDPFRVVEGADVLFARAGRAPLDVTWTQPPRLSAEPPSYLGQRRELLRSYFPAELHDGTVLTVSLDPLREGRQLVLTDGATEVPFVDDGDDGLVARWTVGGDATLRIAARFGDVLIYEPRALPLFAIADHAPNVRLDGAPATYRLLEKPKIPLHWEAIDDHGLREVTLVLRAGDREERRQLSKLSGGVAVDRGGMELLSDDSFIKASYLPVEVTVEALDNDPITGPKWGRSDPIVLLPPQIGEREALRYAAVERARDAVADALAARLDAGAPKAADRATYATAEKKSHALLAKQIDEVLDGDFAGLRLSGRLAALVRGQIEQLDKAVAALGEGDLAKAHQNLVTRTENALLAIDSGLRFMGRRDTQEAALKLADVATDAAKAIDLSRTAAERERAVRRLDADRVVLREGGQNLLGLGGLGLDLGEIVQNGLRRVQRAWEPGDRHHAKLAAEDLAARLRNPDPSFGSAGGGHGHGTESGGAPQPGEGEPSSAAEDMAGVERELEQLRAEHQQHMEQVQKTLEDALPPEARAELEKQLREQAKEVREAVKELPQQATDPDSARAAAAQGRQEAEAMAGAMERGDLAGAVEQGKKALESLKRSEQRGDQDPTEKGVGEAAKEARQKLSKMMEGAQQKLDALQAQASERAKDALMQQGAKERQLAERAQEIRRQSENGEAPLPSEKLQRLEQAAKAMESAAKQLEEGKGNKASEAQREAQRLLEMSQPESEREGKKSEPGDGDDFARDAEVPEHVRDERADAFRKRVTRGLGKHAPPHLRDALKKYTEGLLR